MRITSRLSTTKSIITAVMALIICAALFYYAPQIIGNDNNLVRSVKAGSPNLYPNITYEQAFNKFFASPRWSYEKADDGSDLIIFTGRCQYDGKPADILLRYKLVGNTFLLMSGSINSVEQNLIVLSAIDKAPFEQYQ